MVNRIEKKTKKEFAGVVYSNLTKYKAYILLMVFLLGVAGLFLSGQQENNEGITHEVSVSRVIVPVFAYDSSGNPVFDLSPQDIKVYINEKPVEIQAFNLLRYDAQQEVLTRKQIEEEEHTVAPVVPRLIFIVVDTMFNSYYGIKNSKKIANKLLESNSFGDQFVVMENSSFGGLKLIGGPERDRKKVRKFVDKISALPEVEDDDPWDVSSKSSTLSSQTTDRFINEEKRKMEKEKIKFFYDFLIQLKNTLLAIKEPKTILFLSEGFSEILLFEANPYVKGNINYDTTIMFNLKKVIRQISESGNILYMVYSGRDKITIQVMQDFSGGKGEANSDGFDSFTLDSVDIPINRQAGMESLKALSVGTGGHVFSGAREDIVKEIEKNTSAYYELAFVPPSIKGELKLSIDCKRSGVHLDFPKKTAKNKSYLEMDNNQKKVLALSVAMERDWVESILQPQKSPVYVGSDKKQVRMDLPNAMVDKNIDIFIVRGNEDFSDISVFQSTRKGTQSELIDLKNALDYKKIYIVIVEPESNTCIYNQIPN